MSHIASQTSQTDARTLDDALQLTLADRQVGSYHHDDAALVRLIFRSGCQLCDGLSNRMSGNRQVSQSAVVGLYHNAEGVLLAIDFDDSGCRADTALQAVADGSLTCADIAHLEVLGCRINCCKQMFLLDGTLADVVEIAVVTFCYNRVQALERNLVLLAAANHIFHQCVLHQADIQGVGQDDWSFQSTQLFDLHQACRLSKSVPYKAGCQHLACKDVVLTRHHNRHTCFVLLGVDGGMSDCYARHVGNLVVSSGRKLTNRDPVRANSFFFHCSFLLFVKKDL